MRGNCTRQMRDSPRAEVGVRTGARLPSDARRILWARALRAFAYGFGAVLLGSTLDQRGFSSGEVGLVLAAVVAGTVVSSLAVGRWGDRFGRRRTGRALLLVVGVTRG